MPMTTIVVPTEREGNNRGGKRRGDGKRRGGDKKRRGDRKGMSNKERQALDEKWEKHSDFINDSEKAM
jgi:hypothetical protein